MEFQGVKLGFKGETTIVENGAMAQSRDTVTVL
jgi:hypothetical protein